MATARNDQTLLVDTVRVWRENDCNTTRASIALGLSRSTFASRMDGARALGIEWENGALARIHVANCLQAAAERLRREWGLRA